jgi:hypothetical protein
LPIGNIFTNFLNCSLNVLITWCMKTFFLTKTTYINSLLHMLFLYLMIMTDYNYLLSVMYLVPFKTFSIYDVIWSWGHLQLVSLAVVQLTFSMPVVVIQNSTIPITFSFFFFSLLNF